MAIKLYQEQAPFSNKRLDKAISQNGTYTNPVIAPFAFDFTTHVTTLECVIYIRNDSQEHYYKNVVISLMKEYIELDNPLSVNGLLIKDEVKGDTLQLNGYIVPAGYSVEVPPTLPVDGIILNTAYKQNYAPIFEYDFITKKLINEYWIAITGGNWNDTNSVFDKTGGSMTLSVSGLWNVGFRPENISVKFTDDAPKTWTLYDKDGNVIASGVGVANDTPQAIDFSRDVDMDRLVVMTDGSVSDITLYYGDTPVAKDDKANVEATDQNIDVKFSYGYDEINEPDWDRAKSVLIIPTLGNSTMPDISYHPIRMRIIWKNRSPLLTVRDYFIDISYEAEVQIGQ